MGLGMGSTHVRIRNEIENESLLNGNLILIFQSILINCKSQLVFRLPGSIKFVLGQQDCFDFAVFLSNSNQFEYIHFDFWVWILVKILNIFNHFDIGIPKINSNSFIKYTNKLRWSKIIEMNYQERDEIGNIENFWKCYNGIFL